MRAPLFPAPTLAAHCTLHAALLVSGLRPNNAAVHAATVPAQPPRAHARAGIEFKDIARKLAEQWKELDEDAKKPYTDLAAKDKERYKKDMEVYNAKKKEEAEADGDGEDDE